MRRAYLDIVRGLAVLIMVEAHVIDAWTRDADRASNAFGYGLVLGGFAAPLFLFMAGVAVPMSAGSKSRKWSDPHRAAAAVQRRGWEIFGLAFLFRVQAFLLSPGSHLSGLLKVDILNIMGPSIAAAAAVWGRCGSPRLRAGAFAAVAAAIAMLTPIVRDTAWLAVLPDPIEGYVRPVPHLTNFTAFPWIAFVFAGAAVGALIDAARTAEAEARVNVALASAGALLVLAGYGLSLRPSLYAHSNFWTSSPTFVAMRVGIVSVAVALAYAWQRRWGGGSATALEIFGRSSLFVYWIHVEMVYGLLASPIRHQLALPVVALAYAVFTFMLFVIVRIKNDIAAHWKHPVVPAPGPA